MKRAIRPPTRREQRYQDDARDLGCVVCRWRRFAGFLHGFCGHTEIHHRNLGDKHGARQIGQHAVVALGQWHHSGVLLPNMSLQQMHEVFGPSFHHHAREFRSWTREAVGQGGTEAWQEYQDRLLAFYGKPVLAWRDVA